MCSRTLWFPSTNSPVKLEVSAAATPTVFSVRGFEALFPCAGALCCGVCLALQLFLPVYPHLNVGLSRPPAATSPTLVLQPPPCHVSSTLGCPSPPLLLVWMNVSSLSPWLLDFHTVLFSVSSGCFLFLNLLLSFWLHEEAQSIYLHRHLGWKSNFNLFEFK